MAAERVVTAAAARAVTVAAAAQHLADQAAGAARAELAEEAAEEAAGVAPAEVQHPEAVLAAAEEAPARAGSDPEGQSKWRCQRGRQLKCGHWRLGVGNGGPVEAAPAWIGQQRWCTRRPTFGQETGLSLGHAVHEGRGGEVDSRPRSAPWAG